MLAASKTQVAQIAVPATYYFLMKAGFGNQFLPMAKEWGGLWVGNPGKLDAALMKEALAPQVIDSSRIVTYGPQTLYVWRPTGPQSRELFAKVADLPLWREQATYSRFNKEFQKSVIRPDFFAGQAFQNIFNSWTLIPVELDFEIPRSRLIAPIDSLAVYQALNRGTFRPFFRIGGKRKVPHLDRLSIATLPPLGGRHETELGQFVRLYFEGYARSLSKSLDVKDRPLSCLSSSQIEDVIISILNPAQLETVASLFVLDVGLAPDVGLGKAVDTIDVRGTCRHRVVDREDIIHRVAEHLKLNGVVASTELIKNFKSNYSLSIQCKAYEHAKIGAGILLLKPSAGSSMEVDVLSLSRLFERVRQTNDYPILKSWLSLLTHDLTG